MLSLVLHDESRRAVLGHPGTCSATVVHGGLRLGGRVSVLQTVWLQLTGCLCVGERGALHGQLSHVLALDHNLWAKWEVLGPRYTHTACWA